MDPKELVNRGEWREKLTLTKEKWNKKGQIGDAMDILYIMIVSMFILFFLIVIFSRSASTDEKVLEKLGEFKQTESALNNLRTAVYSDNYNLENIDLNNKISSSKLLAGYIITNCGDYVKEIDCSTDPVKIAGGKCQWFEDRNRCWDIVG